MKSIYYSPFRCGSISNKGTSCGLSVIAVFRLGTKLRLRDSFQLIFCPLLICAKFKGGSRQREDKG